MVSARRKRFDTYMLARIAMMCTLAILLRIFPKIPILMPYLKLDFSLVPMLLTGFSMGPVSGACVLGVSEIVQLITSPSEGGVGELADLLCGLAMLLPATLVYLRIHKIKGALIGLGVGIIGLTVVGVLANRYILLPLMLKDGFVKFMNDNPAYLWTVTVPFNLIKGAAVSLVTFLLYKRLSPFLKSGSFKVKR